MAKYVFILLSCVLYIASCTDRNCLTCQDKVFYLIDRESNYFEIYVGEQETFFFNGIKQIPLTYDPDSIVQASTYQNISCSRNKEAKEYVITLASQVFKLDSFGVFFYGAYSYHVSHDPFINYAAFGKESERRFQAFQKGGQSAVEDFKNHLSVQWEEEEIR